MQADHDWHPQALLRRSVAALCALAIALGWWQLLAPSPTAAVPTPMAPTVATRLPAPETATLQAALVPSPASAPQAVAALASDAAGGLGASPVQTAGREVRPLLSSGAELQQAAPELTLLPTRDHNAGKR
jgi:hypothetical protein